VSILSYFYFIVNWLCLPTLLKLQSDQIMAQIKLKCGIHYLCSMLILVHIMLKVICMLLEQQFKTTIFCGSKLDHFIFGSSVYALLHW